MKTTDFGKLFLWNILNPILLRMKKRRKYVFSESYKGINLGCGSSNIPFWMGIDGGITHYILKKMPEFVIRPFFKHFNMSKIYTFKEYYAKYSKNKFIHYDLKYGIPLASNSVPNIFSSHFFEHLFKEDAVRLFEECNRVLKTNGLIRICVPSLDNEVNNIKEAIIEYDDGNIIPIQKYVTSELVGYIDSYSNHRWMYNFNELSQMLRNTGFSNIRQCEFKKGQIPDVEQLDSRDGLFVEASKI